MQHYPIGTRWKRSTHDEKGEVKKVSEIHNQLWNTICGNTGHMLDSNRWLTLEQVVMEFAKYYLDFPDTPVPPIGEIKIELEMLVILGMAEVKLPKEIVLE